MNTTQVPDSEAEGCEVDVFDTRERDNPQFGAVTIRLIKGIHGNIIRMSAKDAEALRDRLTEHLNKNRKG